LATSKLKRAWSKEYVQTGVVIIAVVLLVAAFWFSVQIVLHSQYPMLAVASGSMCVLPSKPCDGWSHPFEYTLHLGDLIIVQGIGPEEIKTGPAPYGDIIVFRQVQQSGGELIVHRAIGNKTVDGQLSFITRGDGNTVQDPTPIPAGNVVGKVVMRVPWVGHLALLMRNQAGIYIIVGIIILLIAVEFILPLATKKKAKPEPAESAETPDDETKAL
jgi:signal peptidase I